MVPFTRVAFLTLARDAGFVAMAGGLAMAAFSVRLPLAFDVGATIALIFSIGLLIRALCLTERRFERSEVWRALQDEYRPRGERGRRWARAKFENVLLRFAKSAAAVAGILYGSALLASMT